MFLFENNRAALVFFNVKHDCLLLLYLFTATSSPPPGGGAICIPPRGGSRNMYAFAYDHHVVHVRNPRPPLLLSLSEHFLMLDELCDWLTKLVQRELTNGRKMLN